MGSPLRSRRKTPRGTSPLKLFSFVFDYKFNQLNKLFYGIAEMLRTLQMFAYLKVYMLCSHRNIVDLTIISPTIISENKKLHLFNHILPER